VLGEGREVPTDAFARPPLAAKAQVAVVTRLPDLHSVAGRRFAATCGKCLLSDFVPAGDAADAWGQLLRLGWSLYTSEVMAGRTYAICPSCTTNPVRIEDAVKSALKARKRT
jgi:hypothetical protein